MQWRHEWKHEISPADAVIIRHRMGAVGMLDPHATKGSYHIRSLYFDNVYDKVLREKLDGVDKRDKWRIRLYDGNDSLIHLERKSKRHGLGTKESCDISASEAQAIVDGNISWMTFDERPLVRALASDMVGQGMCGRADSRSGCCRTGNRSDYDQAGNGTGYDRANDGSGCYRAANRFAGRRW